MPLSDTVDTLIVGAGPIGLATAISAARRGIDHLVIDRGAIANSIFRYPVGMTFFTTPELLEIGGHPFTCSGAKPTREEALKYYRGVVRADGLNLTTGAALISATRNSSGFLATISRSGGTFEIACRRMVVATGYLDQPNLLGIPGESLAHVSHVMGEAHSTWGMPVVIVGGRNSAVEAALLCFRAGARVTLIHRGDTLGNNVKYWLGPDLENRIAAGEITARFGSRLTSIGPHSVTADTPDGTMDIAAEQVFVLTGYHPDFDLLERLGVAVDPTDGRAILDPETLESSVPGLHLAGSVGAGRRISQVFIENGRFDGEKIFGDRDSRAAADRVYRERSRPLGE